MMRYVAGMCLSRWSNLGSTKTDTYLDIDSDTDTGYDICDKMRIHKDTGKKI